MNGYDNTDFEAWANLLINRKIPADYRHFVDREVVDEGAAILRKGGAFEVQVDDQPATKTSSQGALAAILQKPVQVTEIPSR